ncbi:DUF4357 domain-containing protein [Oceaniglobus indicus]|uniref:DUF4357 domain-containing protein n=1 Tax=Oceaniglobus indicus TaxID=2047749 RepID=UPI001F4E9BC3|nr:DUF4357 domain-containing protein [Oceaniglobus indicus]
MSDDNSEGMLTADAGASCAREISDHATRGYGAIHDDLLRTGVIDKTSVPAMFSENYAFKSPSAAAAVVVGRPANGRTEWKLDTGQTLADWEAMTLAETAEIGR